MSPAAERIQDQVGCGDCAAGVYASHMLEHLSLDDCSRALRKIRRLLAPAGLVRLVLPDLRARAA